MAQKIKGELRVSKDKHSVELLVPHGTPHAELAKLTLGELLKGFRPSGCQTCLSGQDFNIREKFEEVMAVNIAEGAVAVERG